MLKAVMAAIYLAGGQVLGPVPPSALYLPFRPAQETLKNNPFSVAPETPKPLIHRHIPLLCTPPWAAETTPAAKGGLWQRLKGLWKGEEFGHVAMAKEEAAPVATAAVPAAEMGRPTVFASALEPPRPSELFLGRTGPTMGQIRRRGSINDGGVHYGYSKGSEAMDVLLRDPANGMMDVVLGRDVLNDLVDRKSWPVISNPNHREVVKIDPKLGPLNHVWDERGLVVKFHQESGEFKGFELMPGASLKKILDLPAEALAPKIPDNHPLAPPTQRALPAPLRRGLLEHQPELSGKKRTTAPSRKEDLPNDGGERGEMAELVVPPPKPPNRKDPKGGKKHKEGEGEPSGDARTSLEQARRANAVSKFEEYAKVERKLNLNTGPASEAMTLSHKPTWLSDRKIESIPGKTTTLIGNYRNDVQHVLGELNYSKISDFGPKDGRFNLLSVPNDVTIGADFWQQFNEPWLRQATDRGDVVMVMSNPADPALLSKGGRPTGFGREIEFMNRLVFEGKYEFIEQEGKYVSRK